MATTSNGFRQLWNCALTFEEVDKTHPAGYTRAEHGESKRAGTYGEGFGGEPLVVLLDGDDGEWFIKAAGEAMKREGWDDLRALDEVQRMRAGIR